jgi:hypothetical protein
LEDSLTNLIGSDVLNIYGSIHDLTVYLRVNSTSSKDHLADIVLSDDSIIYILTSVPNLLKNRFTIRQLCA